VLAAADEPGVLFNREGGGWQPFPYRGGRLSARYRLLRDPAVGEEAGVLALKVSGTQQQVSSEMVDSTTVVTLNYQDGGLSKTPIDGKLVLDLEVTAHAPGTITFQKVTAQY